MKNAILYDKYVFYNIKFIKYHYTDCRVGTPLNYIAYMKKGTAKIVTDNQTLDLSPGDVFFIPKNLKYQSYWYGDDEIDFLSYGFYSLNTSENTKFRLQKVACSENTLQKIVNIPTDGKSVKCSTLSLFYGAMAEVIPLLEPAMQSNDTEICEKIKSCIQEHPHLSISEIAAMCAVSEPYLYVLFKKTERLTPNDYRQKLLCETASELLVTTNKKIEEISGMMKFSSSSYFRKVMKKHTGLTPREIRKNSFF